MIGYEAAAGHAEMMLELSLQVLHVTSDNSPRLAALGCLHIFWLLTCLLTMPMAHSVVNRHTDARVQPLFTATSKSLPAQRVRFISEDTICLFFGGSTVSEGINVGMFSKVYHRRYRCLMCHIQVIVCPRHRRSFSQVISWCPSRKGVTCPYRTVEHIYPQYCPCRCTSHRSKLFKLSQCRS
jgi:hypothetical protein